MVSIYRQSISSPPGDTNDRRPAADLHPIGVQYRSNPLPPRPEGLMALTLSSTDLTRLEASLAALAAPLEHATVQAWGAAVLREMCPLLAADQAFFAIPREGAEPESHGEGPWTAQARRAYLEHYRECDVGLTRRRKALGLEVYHTDMIEPWPEFGRTELFNDWCVPYRLQDSIGMGIQVDDGPLPALAHFYHDRRTGRLFGERGLKLLQLMLPAFKAGVITHVRMARHRASVATALDTLSEPLAIFDPAGRLVHANPALTALVAGDPEGTQLLVAAREAGRTLGRLAGERPRGSKTGHAAVPEARTVLRELRTGQGQYRVRGSVLGYDLLTRGPSAMVAVERVVTEPLSDAALCERFRLTPREVSVARLLAEGRSNKAIASALGVSARTAEHHTEHVLLKLGTPSRATVGAMLRGGSRTDAALPDRPRHGESRQRRRASIAAGSRP